MDFLAPLSYITDLLAKITGARFNRPQLSVEIITFRREAEKKRWIFRAAVLNRGRLSADGCEGFWSLFDSRLDELSSGTGVFWAPQADDDYDFENRTCRTARLEYNEKRFCWAEIEITGDPMDGSGMYFFPYDHSVGPHTLALIIEYGQLKTFDFVIINLPQHISPSCSFDAVSDTAQWQHLGGLKAMFHRIRLRKHIFKIDYHNYIRPT